MVRMIFEINNDFKNESVARGMISYEQRIIHSKPKPTNY